MPTGIQEAKAPRSQPLLPKWANAQDGWCRAIVAGVLKNCVEASDLDIDRYLKQFLSEKKLSQESLEAVPKIEERQADTGPLDSVRLDAVTIGDGVNALKTGAQIDFSPGVTVVFGENGSGKSGFVRVLKRAAGVRAAEDILPNVRSGKRPTPSATFTVTVGDKAETVAWANEFGLAPFTRVGIFDASGARLHVEDDLTYVYTPGELTFFPLVQNAIERLRTALEGVISARNPGANTLLASFDRACSVYPAIETLGAGTDLDEIRAYAVLSEDAGTTIESLDLEIDALRSSNIQNALKRARDRATVVNALAAAVDTAAAFDVATYGAHVRARNDAAQRHTEAGAKAFEGLAIPGVLGPEWRQFVQAGETYLRGSAAGSYPTLDAPCAYCQQPLTAAAVDLVRKYREFVNDELRAALDAAERQLGEYSNAVAGLNADALVAQLAAETAGQADVLDRVAPLLAKLRTLAANAANRSGIAWQDKQSSLVGPTAILSAEAERLDTLTTSLQESVGERQAALEAKQIERTELQGKETVNAVLPQIERRVSDAKWVGRANIVKSNLTSVLRSLTEAAKEASEELLNRDFGKRFEDECRLLRAPSVTLNFPGRQGRVTRRKLVASYKPAQVLSEGEQKALALADFLAEVTSVPASSPVVFDDPITSMDYRRIHEVCNRIVALAQDHQIIVFTHNIWFAAELLSRADKRSLKYYDIRLESGVAGVVTPGSHPRVDTVARVKATIQKLVESADKADGEVKAALVEKGYENLRNLSEIVVEHEMLKGVVQRYAPNVMMTKLGQINVENLEEDMAAVTPVFEKCCRYIASHSQPLETQGIRPTLGELTADFEAILTARKRHKQS